MKGVDLVAHEDPSAMQNATLSPIPLLQRSFELVGPIYWPLLILASPGFILAIVTELTPLLGGILQRAYGIVVAPILGGAALWLVDQHLKRQAPLLGNSLNRAVSKAVPLVLSTLLAALLSCLASIFLIIPGIYVGVKLALTPCAIALENQGTTGGLRYSWNLVKGRWWGVFWALLVLGLILGFAGVLIVGFVIVVADVGDFGVRMVAAAAATAVVPIFWVYVVLLFRSLQRLKGQAAS
ncbi:hypothetical protein SYN60AY4M2_07530 [Synechococcus sp. 60AY4M2]|jgi:hypothetical protein|uniref:hypothetical protein n=1 Tax=unclassified Synechococcus TaxID=2626047 RepID=UPI000C65374A|nr:MULTISPECIES: hypothetical protein [unclassified Synechococcus]PIK95266.1 hypothetical protein SYN60AY4M2_07530 [Synechococcus sp. 60AY4M2]PIK97508.1 hypothetical protein SYN63AY4M1_04930 [Synechococcus sp. 63AY4M1]PIL01770.1 hypothetical protein SYN65AY640_09125 [Synechococcus sp. 65AY640]